MPTGMKTKLITLQIAAAEYGIPATSLRDLINRGILACVRIGGSRRIWLKREDVDRMIERSTERTA